MSSGRLAESIPVAEEAIEVARAVGSPSDEALALGILGSDLALLGRVDEGVERFRAGIAIAEELQQRRGHRPRREQPGGPARSGRPSGGGARRGASPAGSGRGPSASSGPTAGCSWRSPPRRPSPSGAGTRRTGSWRRGLGRDPVGTPGIRLRIQRGPARHRPGRPGRRRRRRSPPPGRPTTPPAARRTGPPWSRRSPSSAAVQGHLTETRAAVAEGLRMAAAGAARPVARPARGHRPAGRGGRRGRRPGAARRRSRSRTRGDARAQIAAQVERIAAMLGVPAEDGAGDGPRPSRNVALTALCRAEAAPRRRARRRVGLVADGRRPGRRSGGRTRPRTRGSAPRPRSCATGGRGPTRGDALAAARETAARPRRPAAPGRDRPARPPGSPRPRGRRRRAPPDPAPGGERPRLGLTEREARGPAPHRGGLVEPGDRRRAVHQPQDRERPRLAHLRQARRREPGRRRPRSPIVSGSPARPRRRRGRPARGQA